MRQCCKSLCWWRLRSQYVQWQKIRESPNLDWIILVLKVLWVIWKHGIIVALSHYSDVIMSATASQIPASRLFAQPFVQAQINENTKALCHWFLRGESTRDRWIPPTKRPVTRKMFPFDNVIMDPASIEFSKPCWNHHDTLDSFFFFF